MTRNNNETRHALHARSRESNAVVADTTVPHASDKRQTKGPHKTGTPETDEVAALRDYWAAAKKHWMRASHPDYATPAWRALHPEDPRKLAGALAFAEMWRKYGDEIADNLNQQLATPEPLWLRATTEACDKAYKQLLAKQERSRKEAA